MRDKSDIEKAMKGIDKLRYDNYTALSYSNGIRDALKWIIEELPDNKFEPIKAMNNPWEMERTFQGERTKYKTW